MTNTIDAVKSPRGKDAFDLTGKVAAITGSTRGIGKALAVGLSDAGAKIVHLNRSPSSGVIEEIEARGGNGAHIPLDLSDGASAILRAADAAIGQFGKVDILVNNAGRVVRKPILEQSEEEINEVIHLDLTAPLLLSRAFGEHMIDNRFGRIINVASLMSFQGGVNVAGYAAAKSGIAGVTKALTNEWAKFGITVNSIAPGYIATEINVDLRNDPDRKDEFLQRIPAGRWGTPEDLVGSAVFLASAAAQYVNGQVIAVDGGWLAR